MTHLATCFCYEIRERGGVMVLGGRTADLPRFDVLATIATIFGYDFMMMLDELWMNDWTCTVFA